IRDDLVTGVQTCALPISARKIPDNSAIDAEVNKVMSQTHGQGLAIAVIDRGQVKYVHAYGARNAKGDRLTTDTVMYGASLTKAEIGRASCRERVKSGEVG